MTEYSISSHCMIEYSIFLKNPHCMSECSVSFPKFTLYVRVPCIISHQHYTISVVHFHVIHYTTEYNVSVKSAQYLQKLYVYYFAVICQANSDKGGNCRHPIQGLLGLGATENSYDEKTMNRSRMFEIRISIKGLIVRFKSLIWFLRV